MCTLLPYAHRQPGINCQILIVSRVATEALTGCTDSTAGRDIVGLWCVEQQPLQAGEGVRRTLEHTRAHVYTYTLTQSAIIALIMFDISV